MNAMGWSILIRGYLLLPIIPILVSIGTATIGASAAAALGTTLTATIGALAVGFGALTLVNSLSGIFTGVGQQGVTVPAVGGDEPWRHCVGQSLTSGTITHRNSSGDDNRWLFESRALSYGPIDEIVAIYINNLEVQFESSQDDTNGGFEVDTDPYADNEIAYMTWGLGLPGEPVDGMGIRWGDFQFTDRHQPFAYLNSRYKRADEWEGSVPRITALVRGRKIYDPRNISHNPNDEMTWDWSDNPALIAAWYVTQPWSFDAGFDDVDWASVVTAANVCDELVTVPGGTEKRYRMGGTIFENADRINQLTSIVQSMSGEFLTPRKSGLWVFFAGAYAAPVIDIGPDDIIQCETFSPHFTKDQRVNVVHGLFQSEDDNYQSVAYPTVTNATAIAMEGEEIETTLDFEYVQSHTQAQRIASITVMRSQFQTRWNGRLKLIGHALNPGDRVRLTDTNYEPLMVNKIMRVLEMEFEDAGVMVKLIEDDPEIWAPPAYQSMTPTRPFNNLRPGVVTP